MIYNISGRTDIVAFYYPWLKQRLKEGFVDVRHPFDEKKIFRYPLFKEVVDALLICTKNPLPILHDPQPLLDYCTVIHVTITPYGSDLEPHVPPKKQIIEAVKQLSSIFGKEHIFVRYDPIIVNEKYTIQQHITSFGNLVKELHKDVEAFIISFVDEYKNTKKNGISALTHQQMIEIAIGFGKIAQKYQVCVQTCGEEDFVAYGVIQGKCFDPEHLSRISGKRIEWTKEKASAIFVHAQIIEILVLIIVVYIIAAIVMRTMMKMRL